MIRCFLKLDDIKEIEVTDIKLLKKIYDIYNDITTQGFKEIRGQVIGAKEHYKYQWNYESLLKSVNELSKKLFNMKIEKEMK